MRFHQQVVFIFVLLVLIQGKSFSHARRVWKLSVVTTEKVVAVEGVKKLSLQKEIVDVREVERKGDEKKKWKENLVAFSSDYRWPKPHPPKNN